MASLAAPIDAPPERTVLVPRHKLATRISHWINVVTVIILLGTGLQIFNAHPRLYLGSYGSTHDTPVLETRGADGRGELVIAGYAIDTTGLLGWSGGQARGFPAWATIPGFQDLAAGRNWHLFFAWVLVLNGLAFWLVGLWNRHIARDLVPRAADVSPAAIAHDIAEHARLRFPKGRDSLRYHPLQKLSYFAVVALLLPGMIVTGLSMSPGASSVAPWIVDLLGGRQTARTLHFVCAAGLVGFIVAHVTMVMLAGPWNEIRSMVTGKWAIREHAI